MHFLYGIIFNKCTLCDFLISFKSILCPSIYIYEGIFFIFRCNDTGISSLSYEYPRFIYDVSVTPVILSARHFFEMV